MIQGLYHPDNGAVAVAVVRHGATRLNNETDLSQDRIRGHLDVPLAPEGIADAHKAAEKLRPYGVQIIVCSDLQRAQQTAQIIGQTLGIPVQVNPKLRPWNLGDFQGTSTKAALPKIAMFASQQPDQPVPGGESFNSFKERALQGLGEAIQLAAGRPLCVVTHHRDEMLFRASEAVGWPPDHSIDLHTFLDKGDPPGGVYELKVNPASLMPAAMGGAPAPAGAAPPMGGGPSGGTGTPPGAPASGTGMAGAPPPGPGGQPPMQPPGGPPPAPAQPSLMATLQKLQNIQQAISLLRSDTPRGYRIDIEVDTMVAGDHQEERQDATEFIQAITQFITATGAITPHLPQFAPLAAKMLQFGVRKFRTGRDLEASIDEFADQISKMPPQQLSAMNPGQQQGASAHDAAIAQAKVESEKARSQAEITKAAMETKAAQQNDQREQQLKLLEFQLKQKEFQFRMAEMEREEQFKIAEHGRKMQAHVIAAAAPRPMNGGMQ